MSGFEFHLVCPNCELLSPTYPPGGRALFSNLLELPVANHLNQRFETLAYPRSLLQQKQQTAHDLVVSLSGAQHQISTPQADLLKPKLKPPLSCPRCQHPVTEGQAGHGRTSVFESAEAVAAQANRMAPYTQACWVDRTGKLLVEALVYPEDEQIRVRWELEADTEGLRFRSASAIRNALEQSGSVCISCGEPWRCTRFIELRHAGAPT